MAETRTLVGALIAIVVLGGGAILLIRSERMTPDTGTPPEEFPNEYHNERLGLTIRFPENVSPEFAFKNAHNLRDTWRYNPFTMASGTPIVAIPILRIEKEVGFPRHYTAEVRIGLSTDPEEVEHCLDNQFTDEIPEEVNIGGRSFFKIPIQDAAMMQYVAGESYREVFNGSCIAIEQIRAGSSYQDDPPQPDDVSPQELDAAYEMAGKIINTIQFSE